MGAQLIHTDGQTDMKLTVAFRNIANAPKKNCFRKRTENEKRTKSPESEYLERADLDDE